MFAIRMSRQIKCKSKPQGDTTSRPLGWQLSKKKYPQNNKYWQGCGEIITLVHYIAGVNLNGAAPVETAWQFLQKLNMELPYDPEKFHFWIDTQRN